MDFTKAIWMRVVDYIAQSKSPFSVQTLEHQFPDLPQLGIFIARLRRHRLIYLNPSTRKRRDEIIEAILKNPGILLPPDLAPQYSLTQTFAEWATQQKGEESALIEFPQEATASTREHP